MDGEGASSGGINGMVNGKIALGPREASASVDLTDRVHLLPCVIKHDGACPVSQYFKPRKSDMVADGLTVEEAFFRGRKLQGVTVPIPNGYRGYVLEKKKIREGRCSEVAEGEANNWASRAEFQNITYWNHDILPSKHDPIVRSFHWFAVSDAEKDTLIIRPRALDITWGADERYWKFSSNDSSSPVELLQVSWLQVKGGAKLSKLLPEKEYAVKFKVELKPDNFGWADHPVYLMVAIDSKRSWRKADLSTKIAGKEFDVPIDKLLTFRVPKDTNGKMVEFGMYEIWKGTWKGGLVINKVVIEPV